MRFQTYLEKNKIVEFEDHYLNYRWLVEDLKKDFSETDEKAFIEKFDGHLNEFFKFVEFKYMEYCEQIELVENLTNKKKGTKKLDNLLSEMSDFAEFIRINIEGFKKVLIKHDKKTNFEIKPNYRTRFRQKLDSIENLNKIIYRASRLKLKNTKVNEKKENGKVFVRKTTKFWVHNDNLYSLKLKIIKSLPLYVFSENIQGSPYSGWDHRTHDTCVSSVYLDNIDFEQYLDRIHKNQGAEAFRIRWYGSKLTPIVFVERKRHADNWTGYKSNKLRFKIANTQVLDYLNGKNVWGHVKMLNGNDSFELYKEIQSAIVGKGLRPIVRTFYRRTAFQLPNDSSVRLSLDTNLVMIRECPDSVFKNPNSSIEQWRRQDIECEWPFKNIDSKDIIRFPHAILEVKTQGFDETKPEWIEEIIRSSYVEHVHKYSKFMHGVACLYKQVLKIPFWLPQMTTDIRNDPFHPIKSYKILVNNRLTSVSSEYENSSSSMNLNMSHNKKIAMPVRVEPKVFLANERTFLKWVQFAIFLGGVGTAILGMGDENGALCGSMLMLVSVMFIFYALFIFSWRNKKIAERCMQPYDDLFGPTILVIVFLIAMGLSIFFKYPNLDPINDYF